MQIEFFDSYPYRTLESDLQALRDAAGRLDAAAAFVTRLGAPLLSVKTKINRRRLDELLPALVGSGEIKQSGTGGSARYSRTTRQ